MDIESMAWRVIEKYWELIVPVDVHEIARRMKITIVRDPFLPVSGEFSLEEKKRPLVKVNTSENSLRQRFALAHEYGHFVLNHGPQFPDPVSNFFENVRDRKEVEANRFAVALLMPEPAVRFFADKEKITSVEKLSKHFDVSSTSMIYRLQNLGFFN